jgi:hypothetical protein
MKFVTKVFTLEGIIGEFACILHSATRPEQLRLGEDFYRDGNENAEIPMPNLEMEIIARPEIDPETMKNTHIRLANDQTEFVCWKGHLPEPQAALRIWEMWCVGTAWTISTKKDFADLLKGTKVVTLGNLQDFIRTKFSISCSTKFEGEGKTPPQ